MAHVLEAVEGSEADCYVLYNGSMEKDDTLRVCGRIKGGAARRPPPPDIQGQWT